VTTGSILRFFPASTAADAESPACPMPGLHWCHSPSQVARLESASKMKPEMDAADSPIILHPRACNQDPSLSAARQNGELRCIIQRRKRFASDCRATSEVIGSRPPARGRPAGCAAGSFHPTGRFQSRFAGEEKALDRPKMGEIGFLPRSPAAKAVASWSEIPACKIRVNPGPAGGSLYAYATLVGPPPPPSTRSCSTRPRVPGPGSKLETPKRRVF